VGSVAFFSLMILWLWQTALSSRGPPWATRTTVVFGASLGAALIAGWHGYLEHFSYGQADMLLIALFLLAVRLEDRARLSAFTLSLILITKPQMAILLAYFLLRRRLELLGWVGVITVVLLVLPPALIQGWAGLRFFHEWEQMLTQQQTVEFFIGNLNQSLAASIARWTGIEKIVAPLTQLIVGMSGFGILVAARRQPALEKLSPEVRAKLAALTLVFYCVVTPLSWRWLTLIWIPAATLFLFETAREWLHPDPGGLGVRKFSHLVLAILFCLTGLLLQSVIAHALGIAEVDRLSGAGFYTVGNLLILALGTMHLAPFAGVKPSAQK
jgi:hypothetical protein